MHKEIIFIIGLTILPLASFANDCGMPAEEIQKRELQKAVESTEKQKVTNIEITAPGLALISFGVKIKKQAVVTFAFDCTNKNDPANIRANPTGFHVLAYTMRK